MHINRRRAYLTDLYASLLRMKWRYLLSIFAGMYFLLNACFATIFVVLGDCIQGAKPGSWSDAFFFSIQTLSTIGYGGMIPKGHIGNTLVAIESWLGIMGVAVFTGMIFSKFARPSARFLFGRAAVVYKRNGTPSLVFRVTNERGNYVVEASMRATVLLEEITSEGEHMRKLFDLQLARNFSPIFILSWMAIHVIDENSPLYGISPQELQERDGRVIISMSGIDGLFSQTIHAYHLYYADEIVWNARLVDVVTPNEQGQTVLDYKHFHDYTLIPPPRSRLHPTPNIFFALCSLTRVTI